MTSKKRPWAEVSLRPLDEIPAERFKAWQNDPDVRNRTMGFRFPVHSAAVHSWLEDRIRQNGSSIAPFSIFFDETGIGACFLENIDWVNRTAKFGIYIGETSLHSRGAGYCACAIALDFAFAGINLRRVELDVVETNTTAISLYESLGFIQEGVARKAWIVSGEAQDVVSFGLLSDEFLLELPPEANRLL